VAGIATFAVILVGSFVSATTPGNSFRERVIILLGLIVFLICLICLIAASKIRALLNWNAAIVGLLMQFIIAIFQLRTSVGFGIFTFVAMMPHESSTSRQRVSTF
jgi:concentrative nucleoside transporter, CNT family